MDFITFKHSFNAGDAITVLPGIKKICEERGKKAVIYQRLNLPADYSHNDNHPIKDENGTQVCMNEAMFNLMKPLLEAQDYIHSFEIWKGEKVDFDFDFTRQNSQMPLPGGQIHEWPFLIYPQLACDLSVPWLKVGGSRRSTWGIVINFTERYRNPFIDYYFLKEYEGNLWFVGTRNEHEAFNNTWETEAIYCDCLNFLELAGIINNCSLFIGNQSLCWHIADALKAPRMLEVCSVYPNSFPTGKNGHAYITQGALEAQFKRLIQ